MHFIVDSSTNERLFALDYIRSDIAAHGRFLVSRLVLASDDNEKIFSSLKSAILELSQQKKNITSKKGKEKEKDKDDSRTLLL